MLSLFPLFWGGSVNNKKELQTSTSKAETNPIENVDQRTIHFSVNIVIIQVTIQVSERVHMQWTRRYQYGFGVRCEHLSQNQTREDPHHQYGIEAEIIGRDGSTESSQHLEEEQWNTRVVEGCCRSEYSIGSFHWRSGWGVRKWSAFHSFRQQRFSILPHHFEYFEFDHHQS